jgi:two-component system, NarL family, response regulator DevR
MSKAKLKTVRVLLVDDHEIVRVGLRTVLSQHGSILVVGESATVAGATRQVEKLKPDVVLMDVRLPDGSGVDACRDILASFPTTRVIILTSYAATSLISTIRSVSEGRSILDPAVTDRALAWLRGLAAGKDMPGVEKLSTQEERVLALVAEGQTNKEIATALDLSDKTVKNYLANVFHKLRITRRSQAAALFVKRQG